MLLSILHMFVYSYYHVISLGLNYIALQFNFIWLRFKLCSIQALENSQIKLIYLSHEKVRFSLSHEEMNEIIGIKLAD